MCGNKATCNLNDVVIFRRKPQPSALIRFSIFFQRDANDWSVDEFGDRVVLHIVVSRARLANLVLWRLAAKAP